MNKLAGMIFDFCLTSLCIGCSEPLKSPNKFICDDCTATFNTASAGQLHDTYRQNFSATKMIDSFYSLFVYNKEEPIHECIHSLKYRSNFGAAEHFGEMLGQKFKNEIVSNGIDLILPVPIHSLRYSERGYNQSAFIAKGISKVLSICYDKSLIKRIRNTPTQTGLDRDERLSNVSKAFKTNKGNLLTGKNILLIDDVITTGATINECAKALRQYSPNIIIACSVAIV